jgi:2,3-bisphosphoglycerate-dependent phosphoglycerate mutase
VAGERLRGRGIASIVSSPMSRARVSAAIVAEALGLAVAFEPDLREVAYGEREGQPMTEWFTDWIAGRATPVGAEPFAELRARAASAVNRALTRPAPVLVVAHGGLFRALRAEMGLEPNVRARNGVPALCQPPGEPDAPWTLSWAESG